MERSEIVEQLTGIFRDELNDKSLTLTPELSAADVPQWDSASHLNIVVVTEVRFGIKFRTADLDRLQNV